MKFTLLVLAVFLFNSLSIVLLSNAQTSPPTCENTFNTTKCTTCQTTVFVYGELTNPDAPLTCDPFGQFTAMLQQDAQNVTNPTYVFTDSELSKFCKNETACPESKAVAGFTQIKKDCASELSGSSTDTNLTQLLKLVFADYYFAVPSRIGLCSTNNDTGEHCLVEIVNNTRGYLNTTVGYDKSVLLSLILFPPDSEIGYSSNLNATDSELTHIPEPTSILCSNCYKEMGLPFFNFSDAYPLPNDGTFNFTTNLITQLKANITEECNTTALTSSGSSSSTTIPTSTTPESAAPPTTTKSSAAGGTSSPPTNMGRRKFEVSVWGMAITVSCFLLIYIL